MRAGPTLTTTTGAVHTARACVIDDFNTDRCRSFTVKHELRNHVQMIQQRYDASKRNNGIDVRVQPMVEMFSTSPSFSCSNQRRLLSPHSVFHSVRSVLLLLLGRAPVGAPAGEASTSVLAVSLAATVAAFCLALLLALISAVWRPLTRLRPNLSALRVLVLVSPFTDCLTVVS